MAWLPQLLPACCALSLAPLMRRILTSQMECLLPCEWYAAVKKAHDGSKGIICLWVQRFNRVWQRRWLAALLRCGSTSPLRVLFLQLPHARGVEAVAAV